MGERFWRAKGTLGGAVGTVIEAAIVKNTLVVFTEEGVGRDWEQYKIGDGSAS